MIIINFLWIVVTLVIVSIPGVNSSEDSLDAPPWPTSYGPTAGTSTSPCIGPKAGSLQCRFLNSSNSWTSRYTLTGAPLLLSATPSVLVIGQRISDQNYSLLSVDGKSGDLLFETAMVVTDSSPGPYSNACGISSAILDPCGTRAYVAIACGPEPLNLNNYIFAINLKDGLIAWNVSSFGTGAFATLVSSSSCLSIFSTTGSRDTPITGVRISTETGSIIESFSASLSPYSGLEASSAVFTLSPSSSEGIDALVLANEPSHPFTSLYYVASSAGSSPKADLINMTLGEGGIKNFFQYRFVPQPLISDSLGDSVIASFDADWNNINGKLTLWRYARTNKAELQWESKVPTSYANATITAIGYSAKANSLLMHVEYYAKSSEIFLVDALTGKVAPTKCAFDSSNQTTSNTSAVSSLSSTILRGLVIDDGAEGGPIAAFLDMTYEHSQDENPRYYSGPQNVTSMFLTTLRIDLTSPTCSIITRLNLLEIFHGAIVQAPTDVPNTSGLLPHFWPSIALGPSNGEYTVYIPGAAVLTITSL